MASLCDRRGLFVVKVDCKAGKDEEGGGEGGDGGEAAGEDCKEEKPPGQWWQSRVKMFTKCKLTCETIPLQEESPECGRRWRRI